MSDVSPASRNQIASSVRRAFARARLLPALCGGLALAWVWGAPLGAETFLLDTELKTGAVDDFVLVHVEADGDGALVFDVEMDPERVGARASVRRLYFNLLPETSGLWIESLGEGEESCRLRVKRMKRKLGRSGTRLDWRVDVRRKRGHGRWKHRRVRCRPAHLRFRIFADAPLEVDDLLPVSVTRGGEAVQMVARLKRARGEDGRRVRLVGGVYEPTLDPPVDVVPDPDVPAPPQGGVDPPSDGELPPPPPGCRWLIDLFGGGEPRLSC